MISTLVGLLLIIVSRVTISVLGIYSSKPLIPSKVLFLFLLLVLV